MKNAWLTRDLEDGASGGRALSKPASNFDPEVSSVLLNGILNILGTAWVEVLFVENVVDAGG